MSDLINQIRAAQVRAAKDVVVASLQRMGLATESPRPALTSRDIAAMTAHAAAIKAENDAHTQGRLQAVQYYSDAVSILDVDGFAIFDAPNVVILEGYHDKLGISHWAGDSRAHRDLGEAGQAANARRLVACWNACEGVPTETLELAASWGDIVKGVMGGARISAEAAAVGAALDSESLEQGEVL